MTLYNQLPKTTADFFAGIGLVRYAIERQGWQGVYALDYSEKKADIYHGHFGSSHYDVRDIHTIQANEIPVVTLAHASFPCTDTSVAGSRGGLAGHESSAFWGFTKILNDLGENRPPLILLENVEGFLSSGNGHDIIQALEALDRLGYCLDLILIDAAHFVPQSRVRLFITGVRHLEAQNLFEQEYILRQALDIRPAKIQNLIRSLPHLHWKLANLPALPTCSLTLADILDPEEIWWDQERSNYLYNQMSQAHKQRICTMMEQTYWAYGTAFRRMRERDGKKQSTAEIRTDGIAGCLRTPKGGSARQIVFRAGFGRFDARLLNGRECARLMGADTYKLDSNLALNDALFGFGDAVCVPVVEWITQYSINQFYEELLTIQELNSPISLL